MTRFQVVKRSQGAVRLPSLLVEAIRKQYKSVVPEELWKTPLVFADLMFVKITERIALLVCNANKR